MIIVGEKLNGSIKSVAKAIQDRDADLIRDLATKQLERRAEYTPRRRCSALTNIASNIWMRTGMICSGIWI